MASETIRSAWHRLLRTWRPMALWSLMVWGLLAVPLAPLSSLVLGTGLLRGGRPVVGNEELLAWGLTLPGITWAILAGGFALVAAVVQYAGLFHIVTDDLEGRRPGPAQTALDLAPRLPALFRLCVATVAAGATLAAPLAGGLVAIRATVLGAHDINYYLAERPGEWTLAIGLAGAWVAAVGLPVVYVLGRSVLALPAYLDGHVPLRAALRESWRRTRGEAARLVRTLAAAVALWLLARAALAAAYVAAGGAALGWLSSISESLRPLVLATGAYAVGLVALDAVVGFVGFAFVATVLTKAYYEDTDLHASAPPPAPLLELPARAVAGLRTALRPGVALPALALLLAGSIIASGVLVTRAPQPRPVAVIAHRGGPAPAPENTLAALERAIEAGADMAEIDVQRTRDGVVVAAHDADLMRTAGDPRRIRETRYADLAGVVQRPDDGSPPSERGVATLAELLDRADDRIRLVIELKYYGPDPDLAAAVVREIRAAGMSGEVLVVSLDYGAVRQVARLAPRVATGYVAAAAVGDLSRLPVDFLAVAQGRVSARLLREARRRGIRVLAWTVNDPGQMADLVERGVDGLITDHPALAVRVNRELAQLSPAARLLLRFRDLLDPEPEGVEPTPALD